MALVKRTKELICERMKMFTVVFNIGQTGICDELEKMHARIQRVGVLSNTGPDPLENHKATKPAFNVR